MEGLLVNDASANPHNGGPPWTVDSLGIGGPLDRYSVICSLSKIK